MATRYGMDPVERRHAAGGDYLLLGLWLRVSFAGAMVAAAGFASRFGASDGLSILTALTLIAAGGTLAWHAWRRARARLDRLDADTPCVTDHERSRHGTRPACATTSS